MYNKFIVTSCNSFFFQHEPAQVIGIDFPVQKNTSVSATTSSPSSLKKKAKAYPLPRSPEQLSFLVDLETFILVQLSYPLLFHLKHQPKCHLVKHLHNYHPFLIKSPLQTMTSLYHPKYQDMPPSLLAEE